MRNRIKIIVNPISGRGRAGKLARAVAECLRERGCEAVIAETENAGDARKFAGDVGGFDAVCAVGGDGTINEVANGLPPDAPLGIIPSGTANVLAVELGLKRTPEILADTLARGREIAWDLGLDRVSSRRFLLFASAGYDASVVHLFHARRTGPIRQWHYFWWGMKSILGFQVPRMRVEIDGREAARDASWVTISNVASYGGPLVFTPRARADDGCFEVMIQRGRGKIHIVRMFWAALWRYLLRVDYPLGGVTWHPAKHVRLWSEDGRPVPVQIDGDPAGHLPMECDVVPGGIRIIGP